MQDWIFKNPELMRHIQSSLKKRHFIGVIVLYLLFLLLIAYVVFQASATNHRGFSKEYFTTLFLTFTGVQYIATFFMGPILCSNALIREKEIHAYDFLRMVPMHPLKMVIGKLLGIPLLVYTMLILTLPATFICVVFAPLPLAQVSAIYLMILVAGFFTHALGLFISAFVSKSQWASSSTLLSVLILTGIFSIPQINFMHPLSYFFQLFDNNNTAIIQAQFYGISLPPIFLALCFYGILTSFLLTGIYRHLENESQTLLSKKQALIFYGITLFLMGGVFWRHLNIFEWDNNLSTHFGLGVLLMTLFSLLSLIFFILTPNHESLVRWGYLKQAGEPQKDSHAPLLWLPMAFYAMSFVFLVFITEAWALTHISTLLLGFLFIVLFVQLYTFAFQLMNSFYTPFKGDALILGIILLSWFIPIFQARPELHFFLNPFFVLGYLSSEEGLMISSGIWISFISVIALNLIIGLWMKTRLHSFIKKAEEV